MRRFVTGLGCAVLLAGPTVLAFFSGGFFDRPRLWAGIAAFALLGAVALATPSPLPRSTPARVALGGLAGLAAWTALSLTWAPLRGPAFDDLQRVLLYLATLTAAAALLRPRATARVAEVALAAGALVVVGYGLSGRLLPGLIDQTRSLSAGGRLDQPLTYWNAMGALAAMGLVLCARIGGDRTRSDALRVGALEAAVPLGVGLYLTFSRGALAAVAVGLLALVLLSPTRPQLRAALLAVGGAVLATIPASQLEGVTRLAGSLGHRESEGAVLLVVILAAMAIVAVAVTALVRRERDGRVRTDTLALPRSAPLVATGLVALVAVAVLVTAHERPQGARSPTFGASNARLSSVESNRYAYWKVAGRAFLHHPVAGLGSAGFRVEWLRKRPFREPVQDAHSLYIETAAELGLVGLAALVLLLGGVAVAARRALRADPVLAAGPAAALIVWALHAGLDWDWEMPALTLVAVVLAGLLLGAGEPDG